MNISNVLSNKKVTYATKGIMAAVVGTTALKAIGRPIFIMTDKHSDSETKKYTATKEFLYQVLCLGLTFFMVLPAQRLGFNIAKKHMRDIAELKGITKFKEFEIVTKDLDELTDEAKKIVGPKFNDNRSKHALKIVKGGVELGSFVGSIVGLTIVAPLISHELLHPIMHALKMDRDSTKDHALETLEQPILHEAHDQDDNKIDVKA